mgnify:CR=1 FL=1
MLQPTLSGGLAPPPTRRRLQPPPCTAPPTLPCQDRYQGILQAIDSLGATEHRGASDPEDEMHSPEADHLMHVVEDQVGGCRPTHTAACTEAGALGRPEAQRRVSLSPEAQRMTEHGENEARTRRACGSCGCAAGPGLIATQREAWRLCFCALLCPSHEP